MNTTEHNAVVTVVGKFSEYTMFETFRVYADGGRIFMGYDVIETKNGVAVESPCAAWDTVEKGIQWLAYSALVTSLVIPVAPSVSAIYAIADAEFVKVRDYLMAAATGLYPLFGMPVAITL